MFLIFTLRIFRWLQESPRISWVRFLRSLVFLLPLFQPPLVELSFSSGSTKNSELKPKPIKLVTKVFIYSTFSKSTGEFSHNFMNLVLKFLLAVFGLFLPKNAYLLTGSLWVAKWKSCSKEFDTSRWVSSIL